MSNAMARKDIVLEDFQKMYVPLLQFLESITLIDSWDVNRVVQMLTLLKSITNSTFITAFPTIKNFFDFAQRLSLTLQGSDCDILSFLSYQLCSKASSTKC